MKHAYPLTTLETAINYWRNRSPSQGEALTLCPQASALAEPYALMIYESRDHIETDALSPEARQALKDWEAATQQQG